MRSADKQKRRRKTWLGKGLVMALLLAWPAVSSRGAEWQWSALAPGIVSEETKAAPRAYLWIPPHCQKVRGVVVGQHNMEEEPLLEHPAFRETLAGLDFAAVWITPALGLAPHADPAAGRSLEATLAVLAEASGYEEIVSAPVVPVGHSAAASFPWSFAAWNPGRTLAAVSLSGQWPFASLPGQPDLAAGALDGVPGLVAMGEYEWASDRAGEGLKQRRAHSRLPLSFLAEPGGGHFDVSEEKVAFLGLYLKKAAQHRLPEQAGQPLRFIDPTTQGWLVDRWRLNRPRTAAAGPVGSYAGDPAQAFWCFDEEMARQVEAFGAGNHGKKAQLAGYVQQGAVAPQDKNTHQQVTLRFLPEPDGLTFKIQGAFLDAVPDGRPVKWTGLPAGSPVGHASDGGPVVVQRICGPVAQLGPDTFQIAFDRLGFDNPRRSSDIWLTASHPGDAEYKRAVQQAVLRFPLVNREGPAQRITFNPVPAQKVGANPVRLNARSSSGEPVRFYVREGPARVEGDLLQFTELPPRTRFPVQVTVVAWQWGRSIEPKLQSAEPVVQTFELLNR